MVPCERSCHKEYTCAILSPNTSDEKVIAKVKTFQKQVNLQGQSHEVKNYGTM